MTVTVEAVELLLKSRLRAANFPPALERQFEADTSARRCARLKIGTLVSAAFYNCFLVAEWLLAPDVFHIALFLHLCVVTPWMLFTAWTMTRCPSAHVRELLPAIGMILIFLQIDVSFAMTTSVDAAHYQYVVLPLLLQGNVSINRLKFNFARAVTIFAVLCHVTVTLAIALSASVSAMIVIHMVIFAYITLVANYTMERDLRRSYLFSLRDRMRHSAADAIAKHDALTGLANRNYLDAEMQRLWNDGPRTISLIMIDIDHFKGLNDRYGHGAGDLCLKRMASLLTDELAGALETANMVRYGGEEFLVILPDLQLVDAMRVAERIRRAVEAAAIPNEGNGIRGIVTASFGVAATAVPELTPAELIAVADAALYAAKRRGRNQVWPPLAAPVAFPGTGPIELRSRA